MGFLRSTRYRASTADLFVPHVLNFTYATRDVTPDPAVELGTTKPETPTFTITVATGDIPVADHPCSFQNSAGLWVLFRNKTGGAVGLSFGIYLNDELIIDYESGFGNIPANNYSMQSLFSASMANLSIGDHIDVYAWASAGTSIEYQRHLFMVMPTELNLVSLNEKIYDVVFTMALYPTGTGITQEADGSNSQACYYRADFSSIHTFSATGSLTIHCLKQGSDGMFYGCFSYKEGTEDYVNHATNKTVKAGYYPSKITWKEAR